MSAPSIRRTPQDEAADAELAMWPGVSWRREVRGKHRALVIGYRGREMFVAYPCSSSDSRRGGLNHVKDVRAVLRALGATRSAVARSEAPRRQRNRTEPAASRSASAHLAAQCVTPGKPCARA